MSVTPNDVKKARDALVRMGLPVNAYQARQWLLANGLSGGYQRISRLLAELEQEGKVDNESGLKKVLHTQLMQGVGRLADAWADTIMEAKAEAELAIAQNDALNNEKMAALISEKDAFEADLQRLKDENTALSHQLSGVESARDRAVSETLQFKAELGSSEALAAERGLANDRIQAALDRSLERQQAQLAEFELRAERQRQEKRIAVDSMTEKLVEAESQLLAKDSMITALKREIEELKAEAAKQVERPAWQKRSHKNRFQLE